MLLLLLPDRRVMAWGSVVDGPRASALSHESMRVAAACVMRWRWCELMLNRSLRLLLRSWLLLLGLHLGGKEAVECQAWRVWPVDREIAGEVCLRVTLALAFFCAVTMSAADLAEDLVAWIGAASKQS